MMELTTVTFSCLTLDSAELGLVLGYPNDRTSSTFHVIEDKYKVKMGYLKTPRSIEEDAEHD